MVTSSKILAAAAAALVSFGVASATEPASAKSAYYAAVSAMSKDLAVFVFMLDELYVARCGKEASTEFLRSASDVYPLAIIALKEGRHKDARKSLSAATCDTSTR